MSEDRGWFKRRPSDEVLRLEAALAEAHADARARTEALEHAARQSVEQHQALALLEADRKDLVGKHAGLLAALATAETELAQLRATQERERAEAATIRARLAAMEPQREDRQRALAALNKSLTAATEQITHAQRERDEILAMHETFKESAHRQRVSVTAEQTKQRALSDKQATEVGALMAQLATVEARVKELTAQRAAEESELAQARDEQARSELRLEEASHREHGLVEARDETRRALEQVESARASAEARARAHAEARAAERQRSLRLLDCLWAALEQALGEVAALPLMRALERDHALLFPAGENAALLDASDGVEALSAALRAHALAETVTVEEHDGALRLRVEPWRADETVDGEPDRSVSPWVGLYAVYTLGALLGHALRAERYERAGRALLVQARRR